MSDTKLKNGNEVTTYFIPQRNRFSDGPQLTRIESPMKGVLVFYVDVSDVPPQDVDKYMEHVQDSLGSK